MSRKSASRLRRAMEATELDDELAQRRVWAKVQAGIRRERQRDRRRLWYAGGVAASVAGALLLVPAALGIMRDRYEPSTAGLGSIAVQAMFEQLAEDSGGENARDQQLEEFVTYLVEEVEGQAQ